MKITLARPVIWKLGLYSLALVLLSVVVLARPARAYDGEVNYTGTNTNLSGDDNSAGPFNLGFTFRHFDTDYTQAYININGTVNFGSAYSGYSNVSLPSATPGRCVCAFWDDLITQSGKKSIYYATIGDAPNRKFVVQWTNMYFYSNPSLPMGTFQVILYEGSNDIQIQYRDLLGGTASQGTSATIGINKNGTTAYQHSSNSAGITQEQAIRYSYSATDTYNVNTASSYDPVYLLGSDVPASPNLINPTNGVTGVTATPTFEWQAVDLATSYRVLISTVSNFSSTVVNQSGLTGTSYTLGSSLSYNTLYYWRVEAINASGSSFSGTRTFTTSAEPNAAPSTPTSLGAATLLSGGRLNLNTLMGTDFAFTLADTDAGEQLRYRLQIATDAAYNDLIIDYRSGFASAGARTFNFGDSGTYLVGSASTTLVDGGEYYWRVRAEDDGSASSNYASATVSGSAFIYDITAPNALPKPALVGQALISGTVVSWDATLDMHPAAQAYRLEYATQSDFSDAQAVTTSATTASLSNLAAGEWFVRVFVIDAAGNQSSASPTLSFTLEPEAEEPVTSPDTVIEIISTSPPTSATPKNLTPQSSIVNSTTQSVPENRIADSIKVVTVRIIVRDQNGNPLQGVVVTLYSTPRTAITDARGVAIFESMPVGQHTAVVSYAGQVVRQPVKLESSLVTSNVGAAVDLAVEMPAVLEVESIRSQSLRLQGSPYFIIELMLIAGLSLVFIVVVEKRSSNKLSSKTK